ncbi:MAG: protein kinase [Polyangia bacterium]
MDASTQLQVGQVFARYQIVRTIGEGGMGTVYEAFHPALKKRFAIKTLLPAIAQTPEFRARFLREAEVAARINHPNIVRVTDVGSDGDTPYMVMEYLEGQTLGRLLESRGRLEVSETADILLPVISAVAAGHAEGVVHRDLKPENIFLTEGPWGGLVPKVLDFGVSKLMTEQPSGALTGTLTVLGTAAYMSPEQARGARQVDHLSDQYALGLILYEMLAGARAHPGENPFEILYNISNVAIVPLRDARPDCPPELEKVVIRTLLPDPENRYHSLLELGAALLPFASDQTRHAMSGAFRQNAVTAILPASDSQASSFGARIGVPARPPSTPSASMVGATKSLPTGEKSLSSKDRRPRSSASTTDLVPGGRHRQALAVGGVLAGLALLAGVFWVLLRSPSTPSLAPRKAAPLSEPAADEKPRRVSPAVRHIDITTSPDEARISVDDGSASIGQLHATIPADGESHVLRVWAPGYEPKIISFGPGEMPPAQIRLDPIPRATAATAGERRSRTESPHKPGRSRHASEPSENEAQAPKRGVNNAPIIE